MNSPSIHFVTSRKQEECCGSSGKAKRIWTSLFNARALFSWCIGNEILTGISPSLQSGIDFNEGAAGAPCLSQRMKRFHPHQQRSGQAAASFYLRECRKRNWYRRLRVIGLACTAFLGALIVGEGLGQTEQSPASINRLGGTPSSMAVFSREMQRLSEEPNIIFGQLHSPGVELIHAKKSTLCDTGGRIALPPGTWQVNIATVLQTRGDILPDGSAITVRVTLADRFDTRSPSVDCVGHLYCVPREIGGALIGPMNVGFLNGAILVTNSSEVPKTYYLTVTSVQHCNTTVSLQGFASDSDREGGLYAVRLARNNSK